MTVILKHLRYFRKKDNNKEAGLLTLIAAGGLWTKARKHETVPPMVEEPYCPHCGGDCVQDEYHLIWECPAIARATQKEIISTQWLRPRAAKQNQQELHDPSLGDKQQRHQAIMVYGATHISAMVTGLQRYPGASGSHYQHTTGAVFPLGCENSLHRRHSEPNTISEHSATGCGRHEQQHAKHQAFSPNRR